MDLFETLLLNQSGTSSSTAGGGEGGNGTDDNNVAGSGSNNNNGQGPGILRNPRPSRYAQLVPNEACRIRMSDAANDNLHGGKNKNEEGSVIEVVDADKNTSADDVRVYKMDKASGTLELLPEENYDLVYYDDNDTDIGNDKIEEGDGEDEKKKEGKVSDNKEDKVEENAKEGDAMDVDDKDDNTNSEHDMAIDEGDELDDTNQEDTILYIIKASRSLPSTNSQPPEIDTESSSEDELLLNSNNNYNNDIKSEITNNKTKQANLASSTASTLSRALVSRTSNFDKLRPSYAMLLANEQRDEEIKNQKLKEKEKTKKKLLPSPSAGGKDRKELKSPKATSTSSGTMTTVENPPPSSTNNNMLLQSSHKIISSLPKSTNIYDGDTPSTLIQLSKLRKYQEKNISPQMMGVELDDWENDIDWLGCASSSSDDDDNKEEEGKRNDAMNIDNSASVNKPNDTDDEGDCTPDFTSSDLCSFKPPIPNGGYAKRPRRTVLETYDDDPIQLLLEPRNPRLEALDLSMAVDWEGICSDTDDDDDDDTSIHVPLILQSSIAGKSVATLLAPNPTSRPLPFESHPNYQQRYEREMASDITSTALPSEFIKPGASTFGANEALEKYKEARQRKREQMAKDKQSRVTEVMSALSLTGTGRRITSSLMGPGGAERTGRPSRHALGSSSVHDAEYVEQLELVYNHTLVKPDLTLSEYRQFHRPRLPLLVVSPTCPWQFQARVVTEKKRGGKRGVGVNADGSTIVGSYHAMISAGSKGQSKIRTEADLSPSIGDLVVMEYVEERPPLFMTKGMTCRIVNYYRGDRSRCPISAGGGDRPLRKRHGEKAASAKGPSPAGPSNRAERPPRLIGPNQYKIKSAADLIGIIPSTKKKKSNEAAALEANKKAKENAIDVLPEGVTEILHQKVHGPFVGEVEEGNTQTGLISNLFAAPMFRHESEPTDFLMICAQLKEKPKFSSSTSLSSAAASASGGLGVVLRPLPPNVYCVGQTEPRVKVFAPNSNDEKKFANAFIPFQIAKNIYRQEEKDGRGEGLSFEFIRDKLFANTSIPHGQLRIKIKQVANFERANNGIWSLKATGEDDFPGVDALGRKVSPEGVAAYESQCAAIRRLKDLGIKELFSGGNTIANVASVMIYLNAAAQAGMERRLKMKKVLEIKRRQKSPQLVYFEKAFEKLDAEYKEVKKRQEIAKFIYEELQLSPWYLSGEFIDVHKRAVGGAMMKLTGIGDPSGVGEGYNFLREADTRSSKKSAASKSNGALDAQIKKITGTENDLRKLTMKQMASLLRSYGMKDKQISVLKRWDRVHVIRDLSTKAASDGMGDDMERFARGEKLRLSDQRQNYKERIQEISRRQIAALSSDAGSADLAARSDLAVGPTKDKNEVDGSDTGKDKDDDSNKSDSSDDDDFFAEMEMEMTNTGEANRLVSGLGGGGALDSQALSKDAREYAALQRAREEERAMQEGLLDRKGTGFGMGDKPKKRTKVIRRKITKTHPDGTQTVTFEFIVNSEKVDDIIAKKKEKELDDKKKNEKKRKKKLAEDSHHDNDNTCVGQAMFEDEDNVKQPRRSNKIKIKKDKHVVHRKGPGPKKASHSKMTSIKHSRKLDQENRKKKRMKLEEEADLYTKHVRGKGTNNRKERGAARERMPHVIFSDRLEALRSAVEGRPNAGAFHKPVPRDLYPHYYEIITHPIDLSFIREKNQKYGYNTADEFVKDFELMKMNAIKFNGKGSPLANEAVDIWEAIKTAVKSNREELTEMEQAVIDQKSGKKKKSLSQAVSEASSNKPMTTAHVVLDGIQTQVNLGTNLSFLGADSDSDDS